MSVFDWTGRRARRLERLTDAARNGEPDAVEAVADLVRRGTLPPAEAWGALPAGGAWWRGPLADALRETGEPPPQSRIEAGWEAWAADGSLTGLGERLAAWKRPATGSQRAASHIALGWASATGTVSAYRGGPDVLISFARRGDHPVGGMARAALLAARHDTRLVDRVCQAALDRPGGSALPAFCAEHGLAPSEPVSRAAFYVLTGQPEQQRAFDPDGALLATAYEAAAPGERERLRAAMAAGGDYDVLRVIARDRRLHRGEGRYLAERLAFREDLPGLWDLLQRLPLAVTLGEVHRLAGWSPPDEAQHGLLDELLRAAEDTGFVAKALERWGDPPPPPLRIGWPIAAAALTSDGDRLAVVTRSESDERPWWHSLHDHGPESGGTGSARGLVGPVRRMLHFGHTIVGSGEELLAAARQEGRARLWTNHGGPADFAWGVPVTSGPFPTGDGYVACAGDRTLRFGSVGRTDLREIRRLMGFDERPYGGSGELVAVVPAPPGSDTGIRLVGADPTGTVVAVCQGGRIVLLDGPWAREALARGPGGHEADEAVFTEPGELLTLEGGRTLRLWRWEPGVLAPTGISATCERATAIHAVPSLGLVAVQLEGGGVAFHDLRTLEPAPGLRMGGFTPQAVWTHPAGAVAVSDRPPGQPGASVQVAASPWEYLLRCPLTDLGPAALDTVERACAHVDDPVALRSLRLLRTALLARTADGISLGTTFRGPLDTDDIAL